MSESLDSQVQEAFPVPDIKLDQVSVQGAMLQRRLLWEQKAPPIRPDSSSIQETGLDKNLDLNAISGRFGVSVGELVAIAEDDKWDIKDPLTPIAFMAYLAIHRSPKTYLSKLQEQGLSKEICDKLKEYQDNFPDKLGEGLARARRELNQLNKM